MKPGTGSTSAAVALALLAGVAVFSIYRLLATESLEDLSPGFDGDRPPRSTPLPAEPAAAEENAPSAGVVVERSPHAYALRHPSQTFRNTSLTTIIRRAGFRCAEVVSVTEGAGDMPVWRVSCDDAMGYLVVEDDMGTVHVDPVPLVERLEPVETVPEPPR